MSIRIYSKKSFAIGPGAQQGSAGIEQFITVPMSFQDMPEKYQDDPTFKLAVKAGEITVINNKKDVEVKAVEEEKVIEEEAKVDPVEEYKNKLKMMKSAGLKKEAEKYNAEFIDDDTLAQNRKRIFEAYKLSL